MLDLCFLIAPLLSCLAVIAAAFGAWGLKFVYYCYALHADYCYDKRGHWAVDPWAFRGDSEFFQFDQVYLACFLLLFSGFVLVAALVKLAVMWTLHGFWRTGIYAAKAPFRVLYYMFCCCFINHEADEEEEVETKTKTRAWRLPSEAARQKKKKRKKKEKQ